MQREPTFSQIHWCRRRASEERLLRALRLTFLPPWPVSAAAVGCTGWMRRFPFLPWPVAPTQSPCSLRGVPTDRPSPKFRPLGSRTGLLGSPPRMWTWTQWPSQPGATRNMQAARGHLLEPRLQLGLSHLLLGKASGARDVLKTARGQLAGRGAALGDRRGGRGGGCAVSAGRRRRLLGWWSPRPPRPPSLLSIQCGSGGGGGTRALMPAGTAPALASSPTSILTALHQPPGKARPPNFTDEEDTFQKLAHCPR